MSPDFRGLITGPAVVVDDKIRAPTGALQAILGQLQAAEFLVVQLPSLPSIASLIHWRQLGLIVLDWELSFAEEENDDVDIPDIDIPSGILPPSTLASQSHADMHAFIRAVLETTAAPIFILTDASIDKIRAELSANLGDLEAVLARRLAIYPKSEVEVDLLDKLAGWLASKPGVAALKSWNRAYLEAETRLFHDLDAASGDWVGAIQQAASADGVSAEDELKEIISRNVLSRVGRIAFPGLDDALGAGVGVGGPDLRRVLNRTAVIPDESISSEGFRTGDLFVATTSEIPHEEVRIVVTPDCELVRRDEFRLTYLTAKIEDPGNKQSRGRVERVRKGADGEVWSCLLTPEGTEYRIPLSGWAVEIVKPADGNLWGGYRRIGRLMEPYLSHLQQHFALNVTRKGLPRVPDNFFE